MIEVENLTRYFGNFAAIKNLTFHVEKGEILGFLGPNAAGKTTTMRILAGYLPASSGHARVGNLDVFYHPIEVKQQIGYLPENPPLYAEMSVYSFLDFIAKIKGIDPRDRKSTIKKAIDKSGLIGKEDNIIKKLSKGYKQRVGIAQALVHEPEVLILDEPTIGLDPKQIIEVRELIKSLAGSHTVLLSTHILPEVSMTCQRVLIINKGSVVAEDRPENLMEKLKGAKETVVTVIGPLKKIIKTLEQIQGVSRANLLSQSENSKACSIMIESQPDYDVNAEIAKRIVTSGWDLLELKNSEIRLEDVFLQLTTSEEEVVN